jgi:hypothetical protein
MLFIANNYYDKIVRMEPLTESEQINFATQKECQICGRPLEVLPPMLEKEMLITKKAIQYYKCLDNEEFLNKYSKSL